MMHDVILRCVCVSLNRGQKDRPNHDHSRPLTCPGIEFAGTLILVWKYETIERCLGYPGMGVHCDCRMRGDYGEFRHATCEVCEDKRLIPWGHQHRKAVAIAGRFGIPKN
jgi:hypothetical protein